MIAKHFGKRYSLQTLRDKSGLNKEGVSMASIGIAAEAIGLRTLVAKVSYHKLLSDAPLPFIAHWKQNHFIVVYELNKDKVLVADPAEGFVTYSKREFIRSWASSTEENESVGVVMLLETTSSFFNAEDEDIKQDFTFGRILGYLFNYQKLLIQLFFGLLMGSLLQLLLPFLTQSIIDVGINTRNLNFINLILIGQLVLFAGRSVIEFIRGWILLHIGSRINITILSDFFMKLLRLPMSYFDTKFQGDLLQRINDHDKIESFLTESVISMVFAVFNFLVLGTVMIFFNGKIFLLFLGGNLLYIIWILFFIRRSRSININRFTYASKSQSAVLQIIDGIHDIKLNNSQQQKRWEWENIQVRLVRLNMKALGLKQVQAAGALFINEGKNILITYMVARAVINGEMTLGMMLSVQYILGQLNGPIEQFISFIQLHQDAKLSLERLNDIHKVADEQPSSKPGIAELPKYKSLLLDKVAFQYQGTSHLVLEDINLIIPSGQTTAIVGTSGSGKTTLLKLLLRFYEPSSGHIVLGNGNLSNLNIHFWRSKCGVVMQDGFLFSDTIARNIAIGEEYVDMTRLMNAVEVANITEFIDTLPLGFNTRIGDEGNGLSQGQKQRLLIARAVYKDPEYIFFDEATNALDSNNESKIMRNLEEFLQGKTVIIVAHRLSTVKNANQIVVLDKGKIVEVGNHEKLTAMQGFYYNLVKNQLELSN
jgi:ATP-binding cassette subfamily B protein